MLILSRYSANPGMDWAYFVPIPLLTLNFRPHGDNKFELIIMVNRAD